MWRAFPFVVLVGGFLSGGGPLAATSCFGPTIEIARHEVGRGKELVVTGSGWGDDCYDDSAPPAGEGFLGVPIQEIDVFIVQGDDEWLVATGAADANYEFEVSVVVPAGLSPGDARVQASWALELPTVRIRSSW